MSPYYLIGVAVTVVLALIGSIWGITRWLAQYMVKQLDGRMSAFEKAQADTQENLRALERELLEFKAELAAELPVEYVRRTDWQQYREDRVRAEAVLDSKLDAVGLQVKEVWRKLYE